MTTSEVPRANSFVSFMQEHRPEVARAYVRGDAGPLTASSTRNDPATFFPPGPGYVNGAEQVIAVNERGASNFGPNGETELEVFHMGEDGDLAYWVGLQRATVTMKGQAAPVEMHLRITELFRREDGDWKLVHRHADTQANPG